MANAIYPPYDQYTTQQNTNQFDLSGHPGKFFKSIPATGSLWFTGSNYGAGAVLPGPSAAGTIYLSRGGTIDAGDLAPGHIHELSVEHVEGASDFYVLIRNQIIR